MNEAPKYASSQSSMKDQYVASYHNNKSNQDNSYSRPGGKGKGLSDSEDFTNNAKPSADQTHVSQKHQMMNDDMQIDQEGTQENQPKFTT